MLIGVPSEIKDNEARVGLIPSSVQELVHHGHQVMVQSGADNATLPFVLALADHGWREALRRDPYLLNGLNVCDGRITCEPVAKAQDLSYTPAQTLLDIGRG
ncbi:hypothetical protein [Microvirga splendida]|uniref:Alanine dehydrogenase/pyridine nucleotide transhydrogenase N-terminal domain-containing protein n=1 Tax=Microvirga splendida TaxID=2795727 RepID=A0ABS0Y8A1_9HYPH|nr:hypothetical protein [Microvirga splendida]